MKENYLKFVLIICFAYASFCLESQNLAILSDYLNRVLIFDNGEMKQVEHLPIRSYQTGNNSIAYEDNLGSLKIYHNNYTFNASNFVSEYRVTNNLIAFRLNRQLKVFDNGNIKTMGVSVPYWEVNDDVLVWFDDLDRKLNVYYGHKVFELDDALASDDLKDFQTGKNTVVFTDSRNNVNIFYQGEIFEVFYKDRAKSIKAGQDIVAFVEEPMNNFQIFYKGDFYEVEPFEPISYQVADGILAYVDNSNYLKVFYNYKFSTISMHSPNFYHAVDKLIVYGVQNYFKVYYDGKEYTLENFIPNQYLVKNNVVVYTDQHGNLKYFKEGKTEVISYEHLTGFELQGSCVKYSFGVRSENIYSKGKTYRND